MPLAGAFFAGCSVAVVIRIPDAVPQRLKPPQVPDAYGTLRRASLAQGRLRTKSRSLPDRAFPKLPQSLLRYCGSDRFGALLLFLPVADCGADRVLGQY